MILAIDPGPTESAYVTFDEKAHRLIDFGKRANADLRMLCSAFTGPCVIEMIACYGMPVGAEVFQTCVWIGRFIECRPRNEHSTITRGAVKLQICGTVRAKDANVRQALIDRFGGDSHAIGNKAKRGPLYKVSGDVWAALAVAVTYAERTKAMQVAA